MLVILVTRVTVLPVGTLVTVVKNVKLLTRKSILTVSSKVTMGDVGALTSLLIKVTIVINIHCSLKCL